MTIGEFFGKPFEIDIDKCNKNKFKLFYYIKDILDLMYYKNYQPL